MAAMPPCVSAFRVNNARAAFHHNPGGVEKLFMASLFMASLFMACCSVSHELLGKIPDSYYEPLKPMRLHLLWHNTHITSLVLDHMESSLLNLAQLPGRNVNGFCSSSSSIMLHAGSCSQLQQIIWAQPSALRTASPPLPVKDNRRDPEACLRGREEHHLKSRSVRVLLT